MLAALLLLIVYLDRPIQHLAVIVAGLGFGTFIDEIGKFVTSDTDYFFRPAVALIYVVFVVLFLVGRALAGETRLTEREALANALDLLEGRLDPRSKQTTERGSRGCSTGPGPEPGLVPAIRDYIRGLPARPDHEAWWELIPRWFAGRYRRIAADPRFSHVLTAAVILYAVAVVIGSVVVVTAARRTGSPLSAASLARSCRPWPGRPSSPAAWWPCPDHRRRPTGGSFAGSSSGSCSPRCSPSTARNCSASVGSPSISRPTSRSGTHSATRSNVSRPDTRDAAVVGRPGPAPDPERQGHAPPGSSRLARSRSGRHVGARAPGVVDAIRTAGST